MITAIERAKNAALKSHRFKKINSVYLVQRVNIEALSRAASQVNFGVLGTPTAQNNTAFSNTGPLRPLNGLKL